MAVFVVLITVLLQIFSASSLLITSTQGRVEATRAAHAILDAISADLAAMSQGRGCRLVVGPAARAPNSAISLVTNAKPPSGSSDAADNRFVQVYYGVVDKEANQLGIDPSPTVPMVCRGVEHLLWSDGASKLALGPAVVLSEGNAGGSALAAWEPLWEGAFRLEIIFILSDGSLSPNPEEGQPPVHPSGPVAIDPSTLRGMVVGLAVLDKRSLKLLLETKGPAGLDQLAASLPAVAAANTTPLQTWASATLPPDLPGAVGGGLRLFERTFFFP